MGRPPASVPRVLSIGGSDSGGGAGIAADLKAFARCGAHGMCAVTAVTAQNTVEVSSVFALPAWIVTDQVRAVCSDIGVDAVKIGMLANAEIVEAVAEALALVETAPVVLDPVMAAETGGSLLDPSARASVAERLVPKATVVTPNPAEAALLSGESDTDSAARAILERGCTAVVVTGGHTSSGSDLYFDRTQTVELAGDLHQRRAQHGSGCTHSSALACQLAFGLQPLEAARRARAIASAAVAAGLEDIGAGSGPVDVFGLKALASARPRR